MISIIIPAYNEEKYIAKTLAHIQKLAYPKDSFEVLVIENASSDNTLEIAKKIADEHIKIFHVETKGTSKAKNFGIKQISEKSEWIVFLDADTILEPTFLKDLEVYLSQNVQKNSVIGTTSVKPLENKDWYAVLWMKVYDFGHKYTKTSFAIQIMKASLKNKVQFHEGLTLAEDLDLIKECLAYGDFFYFDTNTVLTSTRRFEKIGWVTLFFKWNYDAFLWRLRKIKPDYPVVR